MVVFKDDGDARFTEMAEIAGKAGGLSKEQWPGLAIIFRAIAKEEREACAKLAQDYGISRYHYEQEPGKAKQDAFTAANSIAALIRGRGET